MSKLGIDECSLNLNKISKAEGSELGKIYGSNVTQIWRRGTRDRKNTKEKTVRVTSKLWRDEHICFTSLSQFSHPLFFYTAVCLKWWKRWNKKKDWTLNNGTALSVCYWLVMTAGCCLFICLPPAGHAWSAAERSESGEEKKKGNVFGGGRKMCQSRPI